MTAKKFTNKYLSYSRLSRFEQCPLSFRLHYIDKHTAEPGVPLVFGKLIHEVLEVLIREHMEQECCSALSEEHAIELYRNGWAKAGLTGMEPFQEGIQILRDFIRDQEKLDHRNVLAVEKEFHIPIGRFTVLGYIDRVDWVDDETVDVIDYKTNRLLFTHEEVEQSLQMSLYDLAARQLWPWVKNVKLTFHMLRHGIRMPTERTLQELEAAKAYVETVGEMTEQATEFPARINSNCVYCDHRHHCAAYINALKGKRDVICNDTNDLETVAKEREEVSRVIKILYDRKNQLDKVLKTHLKEHEELVAGGVRYRMFNTTRLDYPFEQTLDFLSDKTGIAKQELIPRLATIDKKALDKLLKDNSSSRAQTRLIKTELESMASKTYSPRLWATGVSA